MAWPLIGSNRRLTWPEEKESDRDRGYSDLASRDTEVGLASRDTGVGLASRDTENTFLPTGGLETGLTLFEDELVFAERFGSYI